MRFPMVSEIASKDVVSIDINSSLNAAIEKMMSNNHRNIIITGANSFKILTVHNMLSFKSQKIDLNTPLKELPLTIVNTINHKTDILGTIEFLNCEIEYICVLNDNDSLYGIISHTDIITNIDPDALMENFCLYDFLRLSKRAKWVQKEVQTAILLKEMLADSLDSVVVVEDSKPLGIFTTKDIMRLVKEDCDTSAPISRYMTSPVDTISRQASVKETLSFLAIKHYKRVVVVDEDGKIAGVVSQKELISMTYSNWAILMKRHQDELSQINKKLLNNSEHFENLATKDALTGLYNRHKFSELFTSLQKHMIEREEELAIIMVDIDHFKHVNDTYGHNQGDRILMEVAKSLKSNLRHMDVVCRWGGEEFIMLLPTADLANAILLANKARMRLQELEHQNIGTVTASFGVALVSSSDSLQNAVEKADKALYEAKESGRNCVKIY